MVEFESDERIHMRNIQLELSGMCKGGNGSTIKICEEQNQWLLEDPLMKGVNCLLSGWITKNQGEDLWWQIKS